MSVQVVTTIKSGLTEGPAERPLPNLKECTEVQVSDRVELLEQPQSKIGERDNYERLGKAELCRLLSVRDQLLSLQGNTIAKLQAAMAKKEPSETPSSLLHPDLPDAQRAVLLAILNLPDDAFVEAEKLMEPLVGQPMTQSFCNSFKGILRKKSWGVACHKCQRPSILVWHVNTRCLEGGSAEFSHASPGPHGGLTKICRFSICKKVDKRRRQV